MLIKSNAKINLSLNVIKRLRTVGLHEIQSFFCIINLFDQIKISKIKGSKDIIKFSGKFAKYVDKEKNSIKKTLNLLRKNNKISNFYSVKVNKRIPVFGGMGGGTSNAYSVLRCLNKNKPDKDLYSALVDKVGTDFNLFLYKQGYLENLRKIKRLPKNYSLNFLLVFPNLKCSTKQVYLKVRNFSSKSKFNLSKIEKKVQFIELLKSKKNDLQSIVEKQYPIIGKLILEINKNKGCYFSRLTGSGSVCYGVFKSEKTAKAALINIKSKYPRFWYYVAKTI